MYVIIMYITIGSSRLYVNITVMNMKSIRNEALIKHKSSSFFFQRNTSFCLSSTRSPESCGAEKFVKLEI